MLGNKIRKVKVDRVSIYRATDIAKNRIKKMQSQLEDVERDPRKNERLEDCKCKYCFYIHNVRMGGAMFTSQQCGLCNEVMSFPSTATDPICSSCAQENNLCKQCSGDMDMKHIRKNRPYESNNT